MDKVAIEQRLVHYFLAMGALQDEAARIPKSDLAFTRGSEKILVLILRNEEVLQRNKVIETVLALPSLQSSSQLVYLAAPRLLGASVDAAIFRSYGIGLLLFDERKIDEALSPRALEPSLPAQERPGLTTEVMTELMALKSMYAEMEQNLARLRTDLEAYQRTEHDHTLSEPLPPSHLTPREPRILETTIPDTSLPPFFTNNPWVDVLSKRGRSGIDQIAG